MRFLAIYAKVPVQMKKQYFDESTGNILSAGTKLHAATNTKHHLISLTEN